MSNFLRENWLWIVTPIVLVLLTVGGLLVVAGSPFLAPYIYSLF